MRDTIFKIFDGSPISKLGQGSSVAVVGGSLADPECVSLAGKAKKIVALGIENSEVFFDLNLNQPNSLKYDLVLCSQVLEHVWRPETALANLANLVVEGGAIWIGCPASNFPHGSPSYYSVGYTDEFLTANLRLLGLEIIESGQICSRRNYIARHRFNIWLSQKETKFPLRYIKSHSLAESLNRFVSLSPQLLYLTFLKEKHDLIWAVESYVAAKKIS